MEESGLSRLEGIGNAVRKKRTHTFRRRPEPSCDISPLPYRPPSDDARACSSDENSGGDNQSRRKVLSLSQCTSKFLGAGGPESDKATKKSKKADAGLDELYGTRSVRDDSESGRGGSNKKRSSEGALGPANRKPEESSAPSIEGLGAGTGNKVKKVKLKLGGVTRTIDANSFLKNSHASDTTSSRPKANHKDDLNSDNLAHSGKRSGLQGIPWKDFSRVGISLGREESSPAKGSGKNGSKPDSARKSRRAAKKRASNSLDDDDSDDEIRYLEKLKNPRLLSGFGDNDEGSSKKHRKLSMFSGNGPQCTEDTSLSGSGQLGTDGKKRSSSEDTNFDEDEELISDGEPDTQKKKKARREPVDSPVEPKLTLTARQRALHSVKDASVPGRSVVEFPNGLPPAPSRSKPKEVLTEVEQQLKKAEAAQKRKMQNEKAARESEAEAIRKILGQDSSRKKKDDKKKKHVADLAKVKAADELMLASSTVRLVMGPNGTTVTFPNEMGLPSIFSSGPCSYPPPREKCVGPSCSNPYKYRDSKTKLPLCSLQCYKAVQGNVQSEAATC